MTIVLPRLDRTTAAERGLTIADFLVPIGIAERIDTRVRHIALVVAGALLGIGLGLVVGGLMVILAGGRVDVASGMPWPIIGLALVLGIVVAMLAAAYPARLASRLSIVRAVQYE